MIRITKNLASIPVSLIPAYADLFPDRAGNRQVVAIPQLSRTTHARRMELIVAGSYVDNANYNNRYKLADIRQVLQIIYRGKCAFCEQKEEVVHVEHYRPKHTYYWLAYSWDNLLLACPNCNMHKGTAFQITGTKATFDNTDANVRNINTSAAIYDQLEQPMLVNPEVTDPMGQLVFERNGDVSSPDFRFQYTIDTCKINRKALNDSRRALLDTFKRHVISALMEHKTNKSALAIALATNFKNFANDASQLGIDFSAFRKYAVNNNWLTDIYNEEASKYLV